MITAVLSPSTYQLEHDGKTYKRAVTELRRYIPDDTPDDLPLANHPDAFYSGYKVGNFVALADSDDPADNRFHVAKITGIVDGNLILQNYATSTQNTQSATWKPLYQHDDGRYRRGGHASKHWHAVVDEVIMDDEKEFPYIRHHRLQFTESGRLTASCKKQLQQSGLKHHVLGRSFP